ncbi:preprotein translocase subunit YajC [Christensenellaceae bacterium 44-20]
MSEQFMQSIGSFVPMILLAVAMILVMVIPQKKRDKKIQEMLAGIKVGDNIKTIGGIYGKVVAVKEDLITIETGPERAKIVFAKGAVSTVEAADVENEELSEKK